MSWDGLYDILDAPVPAGVLRPVYGADGKPVLAARWNALETTTPAVLNLPARCEHPCPYAHGDSCYTLEEYGEFTRSGAEGVTLAWSSLPAEGIGTGTKILRMLAPAGKKRITLALAFDTPELDTGAPEWYRHALVSATVMARVNVGGVWRWTALAALNHKNPAATNYNSVCLEIEEGSGTATVSATTVSFGVWHRFGLRLALTGINFNTDHGDVPGNTWGGEVRVDFGWE